MEDTNKTADTRGDRANDMFMALPDLYLSRDGARKYSRFEMAIGDLTQQEGIEIARALRDGKVAAAGELLRIALRRITTEQAIFEEDV